MFRYINGDPYEYRNGEWIKVEAVARETSIDASRFGASSVEELSSLLKDPAGALELTVDNAFSVYKAYPELLSQQQKNEPDRPFDILPLAIDMPRDILYARLEKRVHLMMKQGLLQEVEGLLESGVTPQMQSMQGIGYKELIPVVQGTQQLESAIWQIILNTRHYAKRQGTWLRTEPKTIWISEEPERRFECAMQHIEAFRKGIQET